MNNSVETCCLCLSVSNLPLNNLFSKSENHLTYYDEISSCLSQLAKVLNEIGCEGLKLCSKCCETIHMVYEFNQSCLYSVSITSEQKYVKVEIRETQTIHDTESKDSAESFCLRTEIEYLDDPIDNDSEDIDNTEDDPTVDFKVEQNLDATSLKKEQHSKKISKPRKAKSRATKVKKENTEKQDTEDLPVEKKVRIRKRTLVNAVKREKRKLEKLNAVHICKLCNKTFKERPYLLQHQKIHMGVKRYMCDICGKSFQQKHHLKNHITVHTDSKPFMCDLCSKTFKHKESLIAHKVIHRDEKPYACDLCGKTFKTYRSLTQHKLYHSGVRAFPCSMCDKSFITKSQCTAHMRTHTGEKAFVCEICNKSFIHHNSLYQHKLLHTGKKKYSCDNCDKSYAQAGGLYKHKRKCTNPLRPSANGGEIFNKRNIQEELNHETNGNPLMQ